MREFSGAATLVSKKVWVVVAPFGSQNLGSPVELGVTIYSSLQDARPRLILALKKANMEEPNVYDTDPAVILTYTATNESLKLGPAKVGDWQQLELFVNSCKGNLQAVVGWLPNSFQAPIVSVSACAPPVPLDHVGIKALNREGANIERIAGQARTPLIAACINPDLFYAAKTLIELGANVNAYGSGQHNGTPLHHAAKNGINRTVKLLLLHGANALLVNDDGQIPLDIARANQDINVVRTIENHISLFSGWMREFSGDVTLVSKKVWVVVAPFGSQNLTCPVELGLAIYSSLQDAQPRLILALKKAYMEEPNVYDTDPAVILTYTATNESLKLGPAKVGDWQQLGLFVNSCKGNLQAVDGWLPNSVQAPIVSVLASAPPVPLDHEFPINMNVYDAESSFAQSDLSLYYELASKGSSSSNWTALDEKKYDALVASAPLAWPLPIESGSTSAVIRYPTVDSSSIDEILPYSKADKKKKQKEEEEEKCCPICEDAPIEGACIPCGHMAGCMECLNKVKMVNGGCPVCRAKIDQVVRIYAV